MNRCPRLHAWCSGVKRFCKHRGREEGGFTKAGREDLCWSKDENGREDECMLKDEDEVTVRVAMVVKRDVF